ncbi:MAG: L-threonylcarbamoyladenylate synthase [Bacteroidales bacterium]
MQEEVKRTAGFLSRGKTILYPTDTIWGIGCDATSSKAVQRVFKIKRRIEKKSMIILVDSFDKIEQYVTHVPEIACDLIESIDTPLTIIYPKARNLAKSLVAADNTIAIRVVKDEFCQQVIRTFGKPIVSTSANISGEPNPVVYSDISNIIKNEVDYIVPLYRNRVKLFKPSKIIKLEQGGEFNVIRQ